MSLGEIMHVASSGEFIAGDYKRFPPPEFGALTIRPALKKRAGCHWQRMDMDGFAHAPAGIVHAEHRGNHGRIQLSDICYRSRNRQIGLTLPVAARYTLAL